MNVQRTGSLWRAKLLKTNSGGTTWFAAQDGGDFLRAASGSIRQFRTEAGALAAIAKSGVAA